MTDALNIIFYSTKALFHNFCQWSTDEYVKKLVKSTFKELLEWKKTLVRIVMKSIVLLLYANQVPSKHACTNQAYLNRYFLH